jgi:hypothetical protein
VEQHVAVVWTPCRFGAEPPWFVCSVASNGVYCGRRVIKLAPAGCSPAAFATGFAYTSQQESAINGSSGSRRKSGCGWGERKHPG